MKSFFFWSSFLLHCHVVTAFLHPLNNVKIIRRNISLDESEGVRSGGGESRGGPVLNVRLVGQLIANQALIGSTIWTGGPGAEVLARDSNFSNVGWLLGIIGALPLIYFSQKVEESESPLFASLNLSTNMTLLRIFGGKPQPNLAFIVSSLICGLTGIVEEVTFRGEILPTLGQWSITNFGVDNGIPYGTVLSTFIFAILHINPLGFLQGKEGALDAGVLFGYQLCTGTIFAILFLATGNLAVPIIAHGLYDFYTFYKTHLEVTSQMIYAEEEALFPICRDTVEKKWVAEKGEEFVQDARQTFYLMDTNRDGIVSRKELRIGLFSYGIKLSETESEIALEKADIDESGEIDFNEFLEFIEGGSTSKAIKRSLLGVS